jgi:hypothetical protein
VSSSACHDLCILSVNENRGSSLQSKLLENDDRLIIIISQQSFLAIIRSFFDGNQQGRPLPLFLYIKEYVQITRLQAQKEKRELHQSRLHKNKLSLSLTRGLARRVTAFSFLNKEPPPKRERKRSTIENNIIAVTPNGPATNDENLFEDNRVEV